MSKRSSSHRLKRLLRKICFFVDVALLLLCVATPIIIIYDLGVVRDALLSQEISEFYRSILFVIWALITILFLSPLSDRVKSSRIITYAIFSVVVIVVFFMRNGIVPPNAMLEILASDLVVMLTLMAISVLEISKWVTSILGKKTSPPMLMAGSFLFIILFGSLLLMLPRCSHGSLEYIDALFLSTSAVCVTGLSPVDISQTLTLSGQVVILFLIQIGGLGVMTITSFFGLFFSSGRKFSGQMVVGDLLATNKMNELLRMLTSIFLVTISIEAIGAVLLFGSVMETGHFTMGQGWFFAIFHSVSAFCNAGFSTLSGNLADPVLRGLDTMRWVVGLLVVFGGIGFPIFSNLLKMAGHKVQNILRKMWGIRPQVQPRIWQLNSYIVVKMTFILIIGGWASFLALEWNHVLDGMTIGEKLSQGFLMSVTPRTAGFNGVNMTEMLPASLVLTVVLMWIGGAPQSTAGGVKVTTIYMAVKNMMSVLKGNDGINVKYRHIPNSSMKTAFSVIFGSLLVILAALFALTMLESDLSFSAMLFEVVSALSTVGLSLGITPELGEYSKIIIIVLMFVGRVGLISILLLFVRQHKNKLTDVSYPREGILIT